MLTTMADPLSPRVIEKALREFQLQATPDVVSAIRRLLALKIAVPQMQVFLIESNVNKATFLAEVVRDLGFTDARVMVSRYEELGEEIAPIDAVCSRDLREF